MKTTSKPNARRSKLAAMALAVAVAVGAVGGVAAATHGQDRQPSEAAKSIAWGGPTM